MHGGRYSEAPCLESAILGAGLLSRALEADRLGPLVYLGYYFVTGRFALVVVVSDRSARVLDVLTAARSSGQLAMPVGQIGMEAREATLICINRGQ